MYQLVSAIARLKSPGAVWAGVDLSAMSIAQIDTSYSEAYLRVSSPFWSADCTMLFSEVTKDYVNRNNTIQQFFDDNGNNTLPSTNGLATIGKGHIKYADAFQAGYKLERAVYGRSVASIPLPSEADTLVMSKPGVDPAVFYKNCLVSINGLIHMTAVDSQNIYVLQAGKSNYVSRRNEVGIVNFRDVGEITYVPITADMLYKNHPDQPYANQVFLKAPVSAQGKTVALVFGGYLFLHDNLSFFRTSDDTFCLDTQTMSLLDRFYESKQLLDMTELGVEYNGANKMQISRDQLFSDETITKWLTMSQSFLVYIDSPNVEVERVQLAPTQLAKQYLTYEKPTLPMVGGFGLVWPYWVQEDESVYSLTVGDNVFDHRLYDTTPSVMSPKPADNQIPYNRQSYSYAYFLDVQSEKIVIIPN